MGYYKSVDARLRKWGFELQDRCVYATPVTRHTAAIYIAAILGPAFPIMFRRHMRMAGRGGKRRIVLNQDLIDKGKLTLGTVLHECAHARQGQLYNRASHHGEAFTRSYAAILRSVL